MLELEWRCACGERFPEPRDGSGLGMARRHVLIEGQTEKGVHRILGLWDEETLMIAGQARKEAEKKGFLTPKPDRKDGRAKVVATYQVGCPRQECTDGGRAIGLAFSDGRVEIACSNCGQRSRI